MGQHGSAPDLLAHVLSPSPGSGPYGPGAHHALFADAAALAADSVSSEPARRAARAIAGHLADLLRRGQADGEIRGDIDPEAAAWLLLSVLSARTWHAAAMPDPDRLEGDIASLALRTLVPATPVLSPAGHEDHESPVGKHP